MGDTVDWTLPVVFHFSVKMDNSELSFSEVSGLETSIETVDIHSGGDNSTVYHLPKKIVFADLVLKRAIATGDDAFFQWCKKSMENMIGTFKVEPKPIEVSLLNRKNEPIASWGFWGAYPVKWSFNTLDAMKGEIVIESVTLKYLSMQRIK